MCVKGSRGRGDTKPGVEGRLLIAAERTAGPNYGIIQDPGCGCVGQVRVGKGHRPGIGQGARALGDRARHVTRGDDRAVVGANNRHGDGGGV